LADDIADLTPIATGELDQLARLEPALALLDSHHGGAGSTDQRSRLLLDEAALFTGLLELQAELAGVEVFQAIRGHGL